MGFPPFVYSVRVLLFYDQVDHLAGDEDFLDHGLAVCEDLDLVVGLGGGEDGVLVRIGGDLQHRADSDGEETSAPEA